MSVIRWPLGLGLLVIVGGYLALRGEPAPLGAQQPPAAGQRCWHGIYPTVLTPWKCSGGVDVPALERQIKRQLAAGVHGLLVLGTIGEGEYAGDEERAAVIAAAVKAAQGSVPVVVGIHTCDLDRAKGQLRQAKKLGADAVLVKYTGNPRAGFCDVFGFYEKLSELNELPIFYYHYPSNTRLRLKPAEVAAIVQLDGVVGIKESTLDLDEVAEHIALARGCGKTFLSGTALNLTQFMELGGHGAMCPEAVLLPAATVAVYHDFLLGDKQQARAGQKELFAVAPLLKGGMTTERTARMITMAAQDHTIALPMGNDHPQARLKAALDCLGVATESLVKCPLPPLSRWDRHKVDRAAKKLAEVEHGGCPGNAAPPLRCPPLLPPG